MKLTFRTIAKYLMIAASGLDIYVGWAFFTGSALTLINAWQQYVGILLLIGGLWGLWEVYKGRI
ncbi:MAG: hypothetical protein KGH62_01970 [Candidatus Micrarchaeota archaeon]|nr:hypothetical protein [Candidatus Micrarchaeota archaeon]